MNEHPILFSAPMVRAILEGRKTQTRRVVKASGEALRYSRGHGVDATPRPATGRLIYRDGGAWDDSELRTKPISICPYGKPGDRLWVRETAIISPKNFCGRSECGWTHEDSDGDVRVVQYLATHPNRDGANNYALKATPSIFMPRWASRITLEITDVRVQRLQGISAEDAIAEGIEKRGEFQNITPWRNYQLPSGSPGAMHFSTPLRSFSSLWDSINDKRGFGWESNPWVWAIAFRRIP